MTDQNIKLVMHQMAASGAATTILIFDFYILH